MHQLHGANRVTEKLIFGREYFRENGFLLRYVISQDGIIDCSNYTSSKLGIQLNKEKYKCKRLLIERLKLLPIYNTEFAQRRILYRAIKRNKKVCKIAKNIKQKPDIIIYQDTFTAIYYLKKTKDKTNSIYICHADKDPFEQLLLGRASLKGTKTERELRNDFRFLTEHVDSIVTICKTSQNYMKITYGINSRCIMNGIEDISLSDSEKYSLHDNKIHIAIVASIQYRKGQDLALDALADLPVSFRKLIVLHIFGDGSGLANLKGQVIKLGLEDYVKLYGAVLNVEKYLPLMDVFMLPSRADTVPIAIIEAMRAGLPIFATNVGEVKNMIEGCGELIDPAVESISGLYRKLINREYDIIELGVNSRKKFLKEFQLSSMINKYSDLMKNICNKNCDKYRTM